MEEVPDEGLDVPLRLEKLANTVTHQRLKAALGALGGEGGARGVAAPLVDVLFGRRAPKFAAEPPPWTLINAGKFARGGATPCASCTWLASSGVL